MFLKEISKFLAGAFFLHSVGHTIFPLCERALPFTCLNFTLTTQLNMIIAVLSWVLFAITFSYGWLKK
jgi:hypothetical protein